MTRRRSRRPACGFVCSSSSRTPLEGRTPYASNIAGAAGKQASYEASRAIVGTTVFERERLYEEVWAEPVIKVAENYDVSGVALAKTCRKLGVPLPPRGYWAKAKAGKASKRPSLPARKEGEPERLVSRYRTRRTQPLRPPELDAVAPVPVIGKIVVGDQTIPQAKAL